MTIRPIRGYPVEIDDFDATDPFLPAALIKRQPVEPSDPAYSGPVAQRWLTRGLVFLVLVGLFWLFGWGVGGATLGWLMAAVGAVGLLPYLLLLDWKARP